MRFSGIPVALASTWMDRIVSRGILISPDLSLADSALVIAGPVAVSEPN
jgi:hypothetical protein